MITELDQLIPREQYEPYLEGRPLDYLQPLADLGFLRFSQTEDQTAVRAALTEFRAACQNFSWLSDPQNGLSPSLPPAGEPDSLEMKLLHLLVDMDGDFQLSKLPEPGALDILSRVIFYRLRLHGFWQPGDTPQRFDIAILKNVVSKLNSWIPLNISVLEWVNLLGDIPELIRRVYDHGGLDRQIVCFKYKPRTPFKESFFREIKNESEDAIAIDTRALQKIKSELSELRTERITVSAKEPRAATTRKNRRRQSEAETLRMEINLAVEQIQEALDQRHQAGDRFGPNILAAREELRAARLALEHCKIDIKQLKKARKRLDELKKENKKFEKENNKLRKKLNTMFSNSPDLNAVLIFQESSLRDLLEMQRNTAPELKHKFDPQINSTRKNIASLEKYAGQIKIIERNRKRLLERSRIDADLVVKKQALSDLKKQVSRIENGLNILLKKQKDLVDEFDQGIIAEQEKLKKVAERYQFLLKKLEKIPRRFRRELKAYLAPDFYEKVKGELLARENSSFFSDTLQHPYNQFLVRLLQLHQWTNGYYNGLIDNDLGRKTFRSIREIDRDVEDMKLRFVLYQLNPHTGTWLLNIRYLFAEMIDSLESFKDQDDFETVVLKYESEIANNPAIRNQKKRIDRELNKTIKRINKNRQNNKLRRVYFGARSLARSIVRGMKRLIRLIVKGLKFIYRLLKNFVLMLYREIREGLGKFGQGIAFLFGKRQITTSFDNGNPAIVTRFDFDCDVRCFADLKGSHHAAEHRINCHSLTHNLEFALILTAKIIEWTFRAIHLTWITILIKIAFYFKKQIKTFLKKNIVGLAVKTVQG